MAREDYIFSVTAVMALSIGVLVYLLDRQPEHIYFIPDVLAIPHSSYDVFGYIGNQLPTFVHVYAFTLLTVAIIGSGPYLTPTVCAAWTVIDCLFEIGQQTQVAQWLSSFIPEWFQGLPFLEVTSSYFTSGTYDVLDIISILLGAFTAYLTILFIDQRRAGDVK